LQVINARLTAPTEVCDAYAAAAVADFLRDELLAAGQSFSFETVMSHRSKIDFFAKARTAGYRTYLYFIATESFHLNIYRVKNRVALVNTTFPKTRSSSDTSGALNVSGMHSPMRTELSCSTIRVSNRPGLRN
jgi:hypothetical protein